MIKVKRTKGDNPDATHFVNNEDLLAEIIESKAQDQMTDKLAEMLMLMARKYGSRSNWSGYSFRDEMVAEAIENLCSAWRKFDETKSNNPFSYLTTCMYRSFLQVLNTERRVSQIRNNLLIEQGFFAMGHNAGTPGADD